MVITTKQLHSTMSELRFSTSSNTGRGVSEICNSENLWQLPRLGIKQKYLLSVKFIYQFNSVWAYNREDFLFKLSKSFSSFLMNSKWNLAFINICDSVIFNYLFLVKKGKGKFVLNVTKNIIIRKWLFLFMNRLLKKLKLNEGKNDRYVPFYFSLRKMFICVYQSFYNVLTRTK